MEDENKNDMIEENETYSNMDSDRFISYPHIQKLVIDSVHFGSDFRVFPKLDGSNCQISWRDDNLRFGTRNRFIDFHSDFQQFASKYSKNNEIKSFFSKPENENIILYGEYLSMNRLVYKSDFKKKFLVFDVLKEDTFLDYDEYRLMLDEFNIEYIKPIQEPTKYEKIVDSLNEILKIDSIYIDSDSTDEGVILKKIGNIKYSEKDSNVFKVVKEEFLENASKPIVKKTKTNSNKTNQLDEAILQEHINLYCTKTYLMKEIGKLLPDIDDNDELIKKAKESIGLKEIKRIIIKDFSTTEIVHLKGNSALFRSLMNEMNKLIENLFKEENQN